MDNKEPAALRVFRKSALAFCLGLITEVEFMEKIKVETARYQAMFRKGNGSR